MLNWELLKEPLNWIIVLLMISIAGFAGHLVLAKFGANPAVGQKFPVGPNRDDVASSVLG